MRVKAELPAVRLAKRYQVAAAPVGRAAVEISIGGVLEEEAVDHDGGGGGGRSGDTDAIGIEDFGNQVMLVKGEHGGQGGTIAESAPK